MTIPLMLNDSFHNDKALRGMLVKRKTRFNYDPLLMKGQVTEPSGG